MLLRNFKNLLIGGFGGTSQIFTDYEGTKSSKSLNSISNLQSSLLPHPSLKFNDLNTNYGTFLFGSNTSEVSESDYFIEDRLDTLAEFSIMSGQITKPVNRDADAEIISMQTWHYTGDEDVTINQIAFGVYLNGFKGIIMKEKLENPITVHKNETFILSFTFGGNIIATNNGGE